MLCKLAVVIAILVSCFMRIIIIIIIIIKIAALKDDRVELEDDMHLLSLLNSLNLQ